jgi:DNA end-binding protein Ku
MPRTLWSGSISFGLVNVPVQLVSGARDLDYHFRQLHAKDRQPIDQRRFCSSEDEEVTWEEVARSFDLDGKQVIVTDEELGSVEPRKTRTIEIEAFVDLADVDPVYFDHPYFLVPAGESEGTMRAYRLLVDAMESDERAALGRFVMRTKEYLALLRARDGALALTTMRFADEVRDPGDVPAGGKKPAKKALDNAVAIIEELATDWNPESYTDCYRERLKSVIDRKRKGAKIKVERVEEEPAQAPDLMAALEATLETLRSGGDAADARHAALENDADEDQGGNGESGGKKGGGRGKRGSRAKSASKS